MSDPIIQPPRRAKSRQAGEKLRDADKVELIPLKAAPEEYIRKPPWIRIKLQQSDESIGSGACLEKISFPLFVKRLIVPI